ncbi:MAG: AzlC family ABC transporter permease [Erysipelotrichaceae bacterium]|nr:AzlC family ABC transporter permease [Erysipelotrichaceae bacterium]
MKTIRYAFVKSIPVLCSYIFLGMAYGILMEEAGFGWYWSLLISFLVYTGAFQFVLTTLLSAGASLLSVAMSCFFINSRQLFYSISFIKDFNKMGKAKPYMIHTLTDETYAVNTTLDLPDQERRDVEFYLAIMCHAYWCIGSALGGIVGTLLPFSMEGIDFSMTALFVTILIGQWEKAKDHFPAICGLLVSLVCLFIFGPDRFMLPSMVIVSTILVIYNQMKEGRVHE